MGQFRGGLRSQGLLWQGGSRRGRSATAPAAGDCSARRASGTSLKALVPTARIDVTDEVAESGYPSARPMTSRIAEGLEFPPQWPLERGVRATVKRARERAGLSPAA